jgi:translation initiation factor 2 alpha subunit (eIF-2alpha)
LSWLKSKALSQTNNGEQKMATNQDVTSSNLGAKMLESAGTAFGAKFAIVKEFAKAETEKLAITLRMIIAGKLANEISRSEAKILLNQQKIAASAVLTAVEGMGIAAVQAAINAALKVVKDFINGRIGFALI